MADKGFGVKEINLIGASGTPTIESPNNLNLNAVNVAISSDTSIGGQVGIADTIFHIGDTNTKIRFPAADTFAVETAGGERLRITAAGKIGIGHHSTSQIDNGKELSIRPANDGGIRLIRPGDTIANPNIHLDITTTAAGSAFPSGEAYTVKYKTMNCDQIFETYAGGGTGGNISFRTSTSNNSRESLRITPVGDIAIGGCAVNTFNNYQTLTIGGARAVDGVGIDLERSDGNIYGRLFADANGLQIGAPASGDYIRFETNGGNEKLRITSDGDVHMGNSGAPSFASVGGNNEGGLEIHNVGNDTAACLKLTGNNNSGGSPGQETYTQLEHRGGNLTFNINHNGTERFKIDAQGNIHASDGNFVVASGHGIDFSATANSSGSMSNELLEDYEQGSFTLAATSNATMTSSSGTYTKIGRVVHVKFSFQINQINSGSTTHVTGLPFSAAQQGYGQHGYFASIGNFNSLSPYATGTTVYFNVINTNNSFAQNPSILGNSSRVDGSITYTTN